MTRRQEVKLRPLTVNSHEFLLFTPTLVPSDGQQYDSSEGDGITAIALYDYQAGEASPRQHAEWKLCFLFALTTN